jgi:hypothetical protein
VTDTGRYHLTLTADGQPVMHGWWAKESTARRQFRSWVGEHGQPDARIVLVDEETGDELESWPDEIDPALSVATASLIGSLSVHAALRAATRLTPRPEQRPGGASRCPGWT